MSLTLAALLAASAATPTMLPACSWSQPGHDPFMGDVVAAVDHYADIPAPVRAKRKARMASRSYDEIVSIRRDAITGRARYRPEIRDMHFGVGQMCGSVSRAAWRDDAQERGLVYCEADHCILVPTVCRNVSRITRNGPAVAAADRTRPPEESGSAGGSGTATGGRTPTAPSDAPTTLPAAPSAEAAAPMSFVGGLTPPQSSTADSPWWAGGRLGAGPAVDGLAWAGPSDNAGGSSSASNVRSTSGFSPLALEPGSGSLDTGPGLGIGMALTDLSPARPVPEPGTWVLMIGGLAALASRAQRRARRRG